MAIYDFMIWGVGHSDVYSRVLLEVAVNSGSIPVSDVFLVIKAACIGKAALLRYLRCSGLVKIGTPFRL